MEFVLVGMAIIIAIVVIVQVIRYERELRRMAQFLDDRPAASNARMTVGLRTKGARDLARAVNTNLEDIQAERLATAERGREMQNVLTALSHDIRTPLAGSQGYLQLLDEEQDAEERERYLDIVGRRLVEVRQLLDELLVYSRTQDEDYTLEREPVDIGETLGEALVGFYPEFTAREWEPHVEIDETPCIVQTDLSSLTRVFRNLIANALRYGDSAPTIVQAGGRVTFDNTVSDPAALDVDRMFDRFYQGALARGGQGSGLGLAIVSELVQAMDAEVDARIDGNILSITVTFPV